MVLEYEYTENVSGSDSGFDYALDYPGCSDLGLHYLCFAFGELDLQAIVVVIVAVGIEMVVEVVLLPHMDMDNMVKEPWEFGTVRN